MEAWLEVELAATDAWAAEGVVPAEAASGLSRAARRSRSRRSRSASGRPDTTSPPSSTSSPRSIGEEGRWLHYGLTSSDVLDTALALQLTRGGRDHRAGARRPTATRWSPGRGVRRDALRRAHPRRPRRAHHLRPAAGGLRLRGGPQPAAPRRCIRAGGGRQALGRRRHLRVGPAGDRGAGDGRARPRGGGRLDPGRAARPPRRACWRAIAIAGAGLERFATEIRNLQRTEVREVEEPFGSGQKGSSAMPHKRNPILAERICGLARVLRGYSQVGPRERRPLARARHLPLRRRAGGPARRDDRDSTTCSTSPPASSRA